MLRGSTGMKQGMGTVALLPGQCRCRGMGLSWVLLCFLLGDSKKGHFHLLDLGMWVVGKAGWIWGKG